MEYVEKCQDVCYMYMGNTTPCCEPNFRLTVCDTALYVDRHVTRQAEIEIKTSKQCRISWRPSLLGDLHGKLFSTVRPSF